MESWLSIIVLSYGICTCPIRPNTWHWPLATPHPSPSTPVTDPAPPPTTPHVSVLAVVRNHPLLVPFGLLCYKKYYWSFIIILTFLNTFISVLLCYARVVAFLVFFYEFWSITAWCYCVNLAVPQGVSPPFHTAILYRYGFILCPKRIIHISLVL